MEQTEEFQKVVKQIKDLEQSLTKCTEISKNLEEQHATAEQEIESHFAQCMNALAARKAILLSECALAINNHKTQIETTQKKLKESIEGCNQGLRTGSLLYNINAATAVSVWQSMSTLPVPEVAVVTLKIELAATLIQTIQTHGSSKVQAETKTPKNPATCDDKKAPPQKPLLEAANVTTFAGSTKGRQDGNGTNAKFNWPSGVCLNPRDKCLYVCDSGNREIRKINMQGDVSTFVSGKDQLYGIALNTKTNDFFVSCLDSNSIKQISASGVVKDFVGGGKVGNQDGRLSSACFSNPRGLAIDCSSGNIYVADNLNNSIRKITPNGEVSTLAGGTEGSTDGKGKEAQFNRIDGIFFDEIDRVLLVCDYSNNKLRLVTLTGLVTTMCEIQTPTSVLVTSNRAILVASYRLNQIYMVTKQDNGKYVVSVLAGSGKTERKDGQPDESGFFCPRGMVMDESSKSASCFFVDSGNDAIRKISFV